MVACCLGIGKGTTQKTLRFGCHFQAVGNIDTELPAVIQEATTFVLACYGYHLYYKCKRMSETRQNVWKNRV